MNAEIGNRLLNSYQQESKALQEAYDKLIEGIPGLTECQKHIRIVHQSKTSWRVVAAYKKLEIWDDDEDNKQIKLAGKEAKDKKSGVTGKTEPRKGIASTTSYCLSNVLWATVVPASGTTTIPSTVNTSLNNSNFMGTVSQVEWAKVLVSNNYNNVFT